MNIIKNLCLHCHSDRSAKDGLMTPEELVETAAKLGAPAITLTDHGVMTGAFAFLDACKKHNINGIVGVEAYVKDNDLKRKHLILLAKDYQGYIAISKAVTDSYKHMKNGFPQMNKDILVKYFGKGSLGHDHVFCTSACVGGVLASIILDNKIIDEEITKIKERISDLEIPPETSSKIYDFKQKNARLQELKDKRPDVKKEANLPTKMAENMLNKLRGTKRETEALANYNYLINKKENAQIELEAIDREMDELKKYTQKYKAYVSKLSAQVNKMNILLKEINNLEEKKKDPDCLYTDAKDEAIWYQNCFGKGNFFIELQYHGYEAEKNAMPKLNEIAKELGIKTVAANDAHYANPDDYYARAMLRADRFKNQILEKDIEESEKELYIKTDAEVMQMLIRIISYDDATAAIDNLKIIADNCKIVFPDDEHYPKYKGLPEKMSSEQYLKELVYDGINKRFPDKIGWTKEYEDRLSYELDVIHKMGYDDYHLIVADFLNFARKKGKELTNGVGMAVGPGRGSAVGSLVCYLLGITSLDPLKYGLIFERYLNVNRVSMPDIDSDFAKYIREYVIDYVKDKYGENAVCGIMTRNTLAARGAVLLTCRVNPDADIELGKKISKAMPKDPNVTFSSPYNPNNPKSKTVKEVLVERFIDDKTALKVIKDAAKIEGKTYTYGRHAAAVIISDNDDLSDYIPLMYSEKGWCTQCEKNDAEDKAKLLKMDFLGLKNLDIISEAAMMIKENYNKTIDFDNIPFEKEVFENIFANGNTDCVFQFESVGMKQTLRQFKPESFEDLILLVAAYRPGPKQYIPSLIKVKEGKIQPEYIVPEMKEILQNTYGKPIYQEQIQQIFNKIAGFSLGEADIVRRAMSKKKISVFLDPKTNYKGRFINALIEKKVSEKDALGFWDELMAFASYAFNKSHAAAYAYLSYITAYLKYHYTAEYMSAVIDNSDYEKLPEYMANCKSMNIKILLPDVNHPDKTGTKDGKSISFGLDKIKGVANAAEVIAKERKNGQFISFHDFIRRVKISKDVIESLINAGACDAFGHKRKALLKVYPELIDLRNKIVETDAKLIKLQKEPQDNNRYMLKLNNAKKKLSDYIDAFDNLEIPDNIYEDYMEKLNKEKSFLGIYVSGHPIDMYKTKGISISNVKVQNSVILSGVINNLEKKLSKKSAPYANFELDDGTGVIKCLAFDKALQDIQNELLEGNVVSLAGNVQIDDYHSTDEDTVYNFIVNGSCKIDKKSKAIIYKCKNLVEWYDHYDNIKEQYGTDSLSGFCLLVYDESLSEIRETGLYVTENICNDIKTAVKSNIII